MDFISAFVLWMAAINAINVQRKRDTLEWFLAQLWTGKTHFKVFLHVKWGNFIVFRSKRGFYPTLSSSLVFLIIFPLYQVFTTGKALGNIRLYIKTYIKNYPFVLLTTVCLLEGMVLKKPHKSIMGWTLLSKVAHKRPRYNIAPVTPVPSPSELSPTSSCSTVSNHFLFQQELSSF